MFNTLRGAVRAGVFESMVHNLRLPLRMMAGCAGETSAVIFDSHTLLRSSSESWVRAGYDGAKRRRGNKVCLAINTVGHLLTAQVTPVDLQDRAQVGVLTEEVQHVTGESVELAFVDQGHTGERAAQTAAEQGAALSVVKLPKANRGFALLPQRWVVERSFAWSTRFRRVVRDYKQVPQMLTGLHYVAFACLMLHRVISALAQSA